MIDYLIMILLCCFMFLSLMIGAVADESGKHFFNKDNSKAMRGFWCLVVILVHVPAMYQNRIQDMIGSFAYIGVTFFFMTSGYGLTISYDKHPESIGLFWRKRLPKLLLTCWLINIFFAIINHVILGDGISVLSLFMINEWVKWLLGCYLAFWIAFKLRNIVNWRIVLALLITAGSLLAYILSSKGLVQRTVWATECFGFLWGMLLGTEYDRFVSLFRKRWLVKLIVSIFISLVLGIAYLRFKTVVFVGDYLLKVLLGIAITMLVLISNVRFSIGNRVSLFLGEISFEIYLIHSRAFGDLARILPGVSSGVFIIAGILVAIISAWIMHILAGYIIRLIYKIPILR